jgi:hypothetical protein
VKGPEGEARLLREAGLARRRFARRREALVREERPGLGIGQDVGNLGARQVMVDGRDVEATLERGKLEGDHLHAVRQHGREAVALGESEGAKAVHDAMALGRERARRQLAPLGSHERERCRVPLGVPPEALLRHQAPSSWLFSIFSLSIASALAHG